MVQLQSESKGRRRLASQLKDIQAESKLSTAQHLCYIQAFNGLDVVHPHWKEHSAFLSLLIQMLISSNTLTGTPIIIFRQISGHPMVYHIDT